MFKYRVFGVLMTEVYVRMTWGKPKEYVLEGSLLHRQGSVTNF